MNELIKLLNGDIEVIKINDNTEIFYISDKEVDYHDKVGFYTNIILGEDDFAQNKISDKEAFLLLASKY